MKNTPPPLDLVISRFLGRRNSVVSRRSFTARSIRWVLAIFGIEVAERFGLLRITETAHAQSGVPSWQRCGLRGHICGTGNCDCPVRGATRCGTGGGPISRWVSCCEDPATKCFHCCYYIDKTANARPPISSGCDGVSPNGPQWGGDTVGTAVYVCTIVTCGPVAGKTRADCKCDVHPECF